MTRLTEESKKKIGEKNAINSLRHGYARPGYESPEYFAWCSMKARCHCPTHKKFKSYGGRGISVCKEWENDFEKFLQDVGFRPSKFHTLDRIENNGNYEPLNVRWATQKQQNRNRSVSRKVMHNDKEYTLMEISEIFGFEYSLMSNRWRKGKRAFEDLTAPLNASKSYKKHKD